MSVLTEELGDERREVERLTSLLKERDGVVSSSRRELAAVWKREEQGRRRITDLNVSLLTQNCHLRRMKKREEGSVVRIKQLEAERDEASDRAVSERQRREEVEEESERRRRHRRVSPRRRPRKEIVESGGSGVPLSAKEEEDVDSVPLEAEETVLERQRSRIDELETELRSKDDLLTKTLQRLTSTLKQKEAYDKLLNSKNIALILAADRRYDNFDHLPEFLETANIEGGPLDLPPLGPRRVKDEDLWKLLLPSQERYYDGNAEGKGRNGSKKGRSREHSSKHRNRPVSPLTSSSRFFTRPVSSSRRSRRESRGSGVEVSRCIEDVIRLRRDGGKV